MYEFDNRNPLPAEPHFRGYRIQVNGLVTVRLDNHLLDYRHDLWNHSPDGFEWGYLGSGPAQLALAMLAAVAGDDALAVRLHQQFKADVVVHFPREGWLITVADVRAWISVQPCGHVSTIGGEE
jgi:Family of unknown function (DUF6166)